MVPIAGESGVPAASARRAPDLFIQGRGGPDPADAASLDARRALVFNWQSRVGYLAIGDLDGVPYLQLCENRPFEGLDTAEVHRLVLEIGGLGDRMERAMSADGDLL